MSRENKSVEDLFHSALDIESAEARRDYLDNACTDNAELRVQVEEMLQAYTAAKDFLERPPQLLMDASMPRSSGDASVDSTQLPQKQRRHAKKIEPVSDQLPRGFGDYELLEKIAHGGMGVVYKARQISLNRMVAIKMILAGQLACEEEVQRFYIEAESAAHLDHHGIVPVFEVGCYEGQHYFSMGFVDGISLATQLNDGPMPPRTAAMYVKKVAAAVHFAHENGIVHRDLKPGNVLLDQSGEPKVTDFGLAKRVEADSNLTATGMVMGTPSFMPPEQASGKLDQINASADVYALGAILYALLTGRPPFDAETQVETLMQVLQDEPVSLRRIVTSVPKDLEAICLKCLEKEPADRYTTAQALSDDLQRYLAGEPIGAKNDIWRRLRKWTLREPVLAAHLVAILVMMTMIVVNYWVLGRTARSWEVLKINEGILIVWAVVVFALQKIHNVISSPSLIPLLWAGINPVFLTAALYANDPPHESLFSLYLLLVVTMGFFRRVDMVAITTATSLAGYVILLILFPNPANHDSYKVFFGVTLVVTGLLLAFQVNRLKRLSQKDTV